MAFDLKLDPRTGDLIFNKIFDLSYAEGDDVIKQRIHNRLVIQRDTWLFDRTGELGSRLKTLSTLPMPQAKVSASMLIREALAPMTDISVDDVVVMTKSDNPEVVTDPSQIHIRIIYSHAFPEDQDFPQISGQDTTDVIIPI